jgi:hypothetical protein
MVNGRFSGPLVQASDDGGSAILLIEIGHGWRLKDDCHFMLTRAAILQNFPAKREGWEWAPMKLRFGSGGGLDR